MTRGARAHAVQYDECFFLLLHGFQSTYGSACNPSPAHPLSFFGPMDPPRLGRKSLCGKTFIFVQE